MESLVVAMVWNKEDYNTVHEYVDYITGLLSSSIDKPFSRTINLPIFYYNNNAVGEVPPIIKIDAKKIIIFSFISENCVACDAWVSYMESLYEIPNAVVVLIALDVNAFHISQEIQKFNFIKEYDFKDLKKQRLFLAVAHEIYRYGFNNKKSAVSKESALKIFLSHAKDGTFGVEFAKEIKHLIDNDTQMRSFFDYNDIAIGQAFDNVIYENIKESSILAINSDIYSSRYWCQKEMQVAKENDRPIVEVNVLVEGIDRRLPFAGNIPVVRIDYGCDGYNIEDLYRVLEMVIIETIRINYARKKLENTQKILDGKVLIMCRPPEIMDLQKIAIITKNNLELKYDTIIYPDPPVYSEEFDILSQLGLNIYTPVQCNNDSLFEKKIGISVSEPDEKELSLYGQNKTHIERLAQMLAKYILGKSGILVYGGDLRKNGFTEQLLREAEILKDRLKNNSIHLINYIAWPIYLKDSKEVKKWKAKYRDLLTMKEIDIEESVKNLVKDCSEFVSPDSINDRYVWSKSLTKMRYEMISNCDARIFVGGQSAGYKGKIPGLLEEILIASELKCPIYLIGGFGGMVRSVCEYISGTSEPEQLKEHWQCDNNNGYSDLLKKYEEENDKVDYDIILERLKGISLRNGLSEEENKSLFGTVYVDEAIQLILKGLQSI